MSRKEELRTMWHLTLLACAVLLTAGVLLYAHYH